MGMGNRLQAVYPREHKPINGCMDEKGFFFFLCTLHPRLTPIPYCPKQTFSQKGVRCHVQWMPNHGENDEKCAKALRNLWGAMPLGCPLFKFWLTPWSQTLAQYSFCDFERQTDYKQSKHHHTKCSDRILPL